MDEIARKRAELESDSRLWSPMDALDDARERISKATEPVSVAIHYWVKNGDGSRTHHYIVSNLTFSEHIALLEMAKWRVMEDWRL